MEFYCISLTERVYFNGDPLNSDWIWILGDSSPIGTGFCYTKGELSDTLK
jgi:hypothetical protein